MLLAVFDRAALSICLFFSSVSACFAELLHVGLLTERAARRYRHFLAVALFSTWSGVPVKALVNVRIIAVMFRVNFFGPWVGIITADCGYSPLFN